MSIRAATPDEAVMRRTADCTRGRVRLVEHTWPGDVRTPGEHRHTAHICFLAHGAIEERRGALERLARRTERARISAWRRARMLLWERRRPVPRDRAICVRRR